MDVVIVTWNHHQWLDACLQSLSRLECRGRTLAQVTVVDNASRGRSEHEPPRPIPASFIFNGDNRGFAAACNQGAATGHADYLLFLNPDTRLHPSALTAALGVFDGPSGQTVGLVGLRLVDPHGHTQRTSGRFPGFRHIANQTLGLTRVSPDRFHGIRLSEWPHDDTRDVDFVCGAALLVKRAVFEALNGFDERLFLYLEDTDLALRARRLGWRARFCADAAVEHALGWSTGSARSWRLAHSWRSLLVFAWLHLPVTRALGVSALVLLLAPLARLGEAITGRSWHVIHDTVRAWLMLCRLLLHDLRRGRLTNSPSTEPPFVRPAEAESPSQV